MEGARHAPYKLLAVGGVEELPNVPHHVLAVVALGHPAPEEPPLVHDAQLMRATARNHLDVAKRGGAPGSSRALRIRHRLLWCYVHVLGCEFGEPN
jgi:hypothetical protein